MLEQGPDFWCWFDISFHTIVFTQYMQICFQSKYYYIHFSQIVPRVYTLVLFIYHGGAAHLAVVMVY